MDSEDTMTTRVLRSARPWLTLLMVGTGLLLSACGGSSPGTRQPPVPADKAAVVIRFEVDAASASLGETRTFEWETDGNVSASCELDVHGDGLADYQVLNCLGLKAQQHNYATAGDFQPRLTVTNIDGQNDSSDTHALVTSPEINISIAEPGLNQNVGGFVDVRVATHSAAPLAAVSATLNGESYPLWTAQNDEFIRTIPVPAALSGPVILEVTSINNSGDVAVAYRRVATRGSARLNIVSPKNYDVADPELLIEADCEECSELRVETLTGFNFEDDLIFSAPTPLFSGSTSVSETVDLTTITDSYSRTFNAIRFIGVSQNDSEVVQDVIIYHQASNPDHVEKVRVPGKIIVADGHRVVYAPEPDKLRVLNKDSGEDTELPLPFGHHTWELNVQLTDDAIAYVSVARTPEATANQLSIFQDNVLNTVALSADLPQKVVAAKGGYIAIKDRLQNSSDYGLRLYDIVANTINTISAERSVENFDVGTDGSVVYTQPGESSFYTWKAGVMTTLPGVNTIRPVLDVATSDGTLFAFWQENIQNIDISLIHTHDGTVINSGVGFSFWQRPEWTMNNNYVAFKREFGGTHPNSDFFLLTPDGTTEYAGGSIGSTILALGFTGCANPQLQGAECELSDDWDIFFWVTDDITPSTNWTRSIKSGYFNRGARGRMANQDGQWYRYIGNVHYRLDIN